MPSAPSLYPLMGAPLKCRDVFSVIIENYLN
jgi:hypothetical protein